MGSKCNHMYPYKTDTEKGRRPCDHGGRDWRDAATNLRMPPEVGRGKEWVLPQSPWRKHGLADTLILNFWPPELGENKSSVVLSHQVRGDVLQQSQGANPASLTQPSPGRCQDAPHRPAGRDKPDQASQDAHAGWRAHHLWSLSAPVF